MRVFTRCVPNTIQEITVRTRGWKKLIEFSRTGFSRTISYTTDRASENTKIAIFLMNYFIYLTVVHEIHDFKQRFSFFFFLEQEV